MFSKRSSRRTETSSHEIWPKTLIIPFCSLIGRRLRERFVSKKQPFPFSPRLLRTMLTVCRVQSTSCHSSGSANESFYQRYIRTEYRCEIMKLVMLAEETMAQSVSRSGALNHDFQFEFLNSEQNGLREVEIFTAFDPRCDPDHTILDPRCAILQQLCCLRPNAPAARKSNAPQE